MSPGNLLVVHNFFQLTLPPLLKTPGPKHEQSDLKIAAGRVARTTPATFRLGQLPCGIELFFAASEMSGSSSVCSCVTCS